MHHEPPAGGDSVTTILDRLPLGRAHRRIVWIIGGLYFFELADLNTFAYAAPALREHAGFALGDVARVTASGFLGMFLGAVLAGRVADRIGRKRALLFSVGWFSLFSLATALGSTPTWLLVFRFLTGAGLSAMTVVAIGYLSEIVPARERGRAQATALAVGLVGIPAAAFLSRGIIPLSDGAWRFVFVFGGLGLLMLPALTRLPESPRWMLRHERGEEAHAVALSLGATRADLDNAAAENSPLTPARSAWSALLSGRVLRRTVVMVLTHAFAMIGFYGFSTWVPSLLAEHGFSLTTSLTFSAVTTLGAVPGALLARQIAERFSRKRLMIIVACLIAVFGTGYALSGGSLAIALFGLLVAALGQTFMALLYTYTAEVFPTAVRASGSGVAYGAGRLGNVLAPLAVPVIYSGLGYTAVFAAIAGCWVIAGLVVSLFGPETTGVTLDNLDAASGSEAPATTPDPAETAVPQAKEPIR
jgi:putative MFS transporter